MYELQSPNYETHQICPKLAIYRTTEQNIRSQSICRALHSKIWSLFITDLNSMDLKNASLKQFDTQVKKMHVNSHLIN